jgi:hypothetical protein
MNLLLVVVLATIAVVLGCKENGCDTHLDFGSCGNACCRLYIKTKDTPEQVMAKMNSTLLGGGPDGQYSAATMAGGGAGFEDLRQYNVGVDFIGQSYHVTDNGVYTDTQNYLVYPVDDKSEMKSKIVGFSISQIGGAFGDDGQNWFNLAQVFGSLYPDAPIDHADKSCMTKAS